MFPPATVVPLADTAMDRSEVILRIDHHIRFTAIAYYDENEEFVIDSYYCDDAIDGNRYEDFFNFAKSKLSHLHSEKNYMSIFQSQSESWYVKSYKDVVYIVATSQSYPNDIAIECIDELYETARTIQEPKWFGLKKKSIEKQRMKLDACCHGIALKYGSLDKDSAAHTIMTQVDPQVRTKYSQRILDLMDQVDGLKHQMNENIQGQLNNIESAEALEKRGQDLLEQAKVFKRQAKDLKWNQWLKNKSGIIAGTTILSIVGGIGGFLIGGPAGAGVLTSMTSVAGAQAIEATLGAVICGTTFLGASSAFDSWFWNQRFIPV